tara:strand:+ start:111 stop:707 length:597 start_codon:yes stop_codon:yes gene_type:complete
MAYHDYAPRVYLEKVDEHFGEVMEWVDISDCRTEQDFIDTCYVFYGQEQEINVLEWKYIPDEMMIELEDNTYPEPELFALIATGSYELVMEFLEETEYEDLDDYVGNDAWNHIPEEHDFDYVAKNVKDIIRIMEDHHQGYFSNFEDFAEDHWEENQSCDCDCRDWIDWQSYIYDRLEDEYIFNEYTGNVWKIKGDENE